MDRTRIFFFGIIGLTLLLVAGVFGVQLYNRVSDRLLNNDTGEIAVVEVPKGAVEVLLASSNTKKVWLDSVAAQFNSETHTLENGASVFVRVEHVTSGGSMNAILDGTLQPAAWSPGDGSWAAQANTTWEVRTNKPLASDACRPTIYAPLGFAMWRPMAEAMGWPDTPIGWDTITDLAANPDGWAVYDRPEWGQFTFGHTHPAYANSGLLSMTAFVYGVSGKGIDLTAADVYGDDVRTAMAALEQNTAKYGKQAPALLELMAKEGAGYLHAAAVPEAEVLRFNVERADELDFPLAFIFPKDGTIWADHPYCVLDNAEWVDENQAEGAALFLDYLRADAQQSMAIDSYLRPLDSGIALHAPISLANGTDPKVNPEVIPALPSPDAALSEAIVDQFLLTKRKAVVVVVLDVSGSMEGEKIKTAREATAAFMKRLHTDDEVAFVIFADEVVTISELQRVGDVVEVLADRVSRMPADGSTALYSAVCEAVKMVEAEKAVDEMSRLYGIILLSDGEDTVGVPSQGEMFATCLPTNAEVDGVKIFPIAFGKDSDTDVLGRIASVTGGRLYSAEPQTISKVYESISAEQ